MRLRLALPFAVAGTSATIAVIAWACGGSSVQPTPPPTCDASLISHLHDPQRLQIMQSCVTVTGVVMDQHASDDGDYDVPIAPDPEFANLLNDGNKSKLNGWLQVEVICQAPIHADVPDSYRACANYTGNVTVPPVGAHIQATGAYTLDHDHGWMEVHPASVITIR